MSIINTNKPDTKKCYFSSGIDESLTCCLDGKFDQMGFPINDCPHFPCEYYKKFVKEIDDFITDRNVKG